MSGITTMPGKWMPIATLTERRPCTSYLIALHSGSILLAWWDEDDKTWSVDNDLAPEYTDADVKSWFDLPKPD